MDGQDARKLSPAAQADLRRRVVRAVIERGLSRTEAARLFSVSRTSVHTWLAAYERGGVAALRARRRGPAPGAGSKAPPADQVVGLIREHTPDQLGLPFALWTREAVQALLAERFGVHLARRTVGWHLGRWGLTPQKPARRAYERDPAAVRRWLDRDYPAIHARAKREGAQVHWGDQMGLRSDHQAGTSYSPRGRTPVVPATGKRFGCSMMATVSNLGVLRFMVFQRRFTAELMIEFLDRLLRSADRKVFLVLDGHPVHRSKRVKRWVQRRPDRIELFLLPGYSPQLNPAELLNQDVKTNALGRRRPRDRHEMIGGVRSYLHSTQRSPRIVRGYFDHPDVAYASPH